MYKNTAIDGAIVFMVGGINVDGLTVSVVKRMQCKILLGIVDRINCKKTLWYWLKSKCTLIILLIKWHVMVEIKKKKRISASCNHCFLCVVDSIHCKNILQYWLKE